MITSDLEHDWNGRSYVAIAQFGCPECKGLEVSIKSYANSIVDGDGLFHLMRSEFVCAQCEHQSKGANFRIACKSFYTKENSSHEGGVAKYLRELCERSGDKVKARGSMIPIEFLKRYPHYLK